MKLRERLPTRERTIVTIKPTPDPFLFRIVGPSRSSIEHRKKETIPPAFLKPLIEGAKEVRCLAFVNNKGRWHIESLVLADGIEPSSLDPQSSTLPLS